MEHRMDAADIMTSSLWHCSKPRERGKSNRTRSPVESLGRRQGSETDLCRGMRQPGSDEFIQWSTNLIASEPSRFTEICGEDGSRCATRSTNVWERIQRAAEDAYDRSESCSFTSLIGYEYTNIRNANNLHRNVIFRNDDVPDRALSAFEAPRPRQLWDWLKRRCLEADSDCDVLAIPHDSNLSRGRMFVPDYPGTDSREDRKQRAMLRSRLEPLMEIYQHEGSMECSPRTSLTGSPDEFCNFEKVYDESTSRCSGGTGPGGILGLGCVSPYNYYRNILATGMKEARRLGANPYDLGVVASTDTHNATPGDVAESDWPGHFGEADATPASRLDDYKGYRLTSAGVVKSPGGLAGVWAVENSRDAIFEALRRRETFGTSGPRITVRLLWRLELRRRTLRRSRDGRGGLPEGCADGRGVARALGERGADVRRQRPAGSGDRLRAGRPPGSHPDRQGVGRARAGGRGRCRSLRRRRGGERGESRSGGVRAEWNGGIVALCRLDRSRFRPRCGRLLLRSRPPGADVSLAHPTLQLSARRRARRPVRQPGRPDHDTRARLDVANLVPSRRMSRPEARDATRPSRGRGDTRRGIRD